MKPLFTSLLLLFSWSCVQPTYRKTVVYTLTVPTANHAHQVAIRGNDQPLSWDTDTRLEAINDSTFSTIITYQTGYLFTEAKFTVDGNFELENSPNRRITFSEGDSTFYQATFNQLN